jgi:hypothetical protein
MIAHIIAKSQKGNHVYLSFDRPIPNSFHFPFDENINSGLRTSTIEIPSKYNNPELMSRYIPYYS